MRQGPLRRERESRSGGKAMDFGWNGDGDIIAAVDFLVARPEFDPSRIAVFGLSMGGEGAIGAAATDSRISAVVADVAVWTVAGAGHTEGLRVAPVEWEATVIGFLERSLGPVLSQRRPRGGL